MVRWCHPGSGKRLVCVAQRGEGLCKAHCTGREEDEEHVICVQGGSCDAQAMRGRSIEYRLIRPVAPLSLCWSNSRRSLACALCHQLSYNMWALCLQVTKEVQKASVDHRRLTWINPWKYFVVCWKYGGKLRRRRSLNTISGKIDYFNYLKIIL